MSSRLQGPISKIGDIGLSTLEVQNPIEQVHKFQSTAEKMKRAFGFAVQPVNFNFFFFLKLNAVCIFWIVLMC
jgi:hypothetical protein